MSFLSLIILLVMIYAGYVIVGSLKQFFFILQVNRRYVTQGGKSVYIKSLRRIGDFVIFEGDDGFSYYDDGRLVGDNLKNSPFSIVRQIYDQDDQEYLLQEEEGARAR